ncbi:unnamed protein product [Zymoseptoria tritici ST99CH_3D1]|nr:unnamed protein product [Zymoseptoria tritici ST99CH_3D1]
MSSIQSALQTQARDAYRRKDYKNAVDLFSRAIGRTPSVQLYDNRAACHDKLDDLPAALQDAKRAIQLCREDPTGYLRAGKVLVKSDKKKAALDIYAYGLGRVKHVGAGYEQLKKSHDDLQGELAPQNSLDPFTVLPRELALLILEHLSFRQRILVTKVSKDWKTFIHSEPNLWQHLDLTGGKLKVSTKFVSKAINVARGKITSATLNRLWDFDKVLNALVKHCPIERLTIGDVGMLPPDIDAPLAKAKVLKELRILPGTTLANNDVWDLLPRCQSTLQVLEIAEPLTPGRPMRRTMPNFSQLRKLDITIGTSYRPNETMEFLAALTQGAPLMEHFRFHLVNANWVSLQVDLTDFKCLKTADLSMPIDVGQSLRVPQSLERLYLQSSVHGDFIGLYSPAHDIAELQRGLSLIDLPQLSRLGLRCPGLKMIHLEPFFQRRSLVNISDPLTALAPMVEFSLLRPEFPDRDVEVALPKRLRIDLESLTIIDCLELDDRRLLELITQLPKVGFVNISGSGVTGAGVKDIILERGTIQHVILHDCLKVSRDAIDWARAKGVKVEHRTSSEGNGGRRVRH